MLEQILLGSGLAFAAAVQPGPLQAYLISQTLAQGFRRTIPAVFAPILSDIPIALLVLLVLTNLPLGFVALLQLVGGLFLLYLAFGAYRHYRHFKIEQSGPPKSAHQSFFKAVLVNLLNPNAYLGWTFILGPLVVSAWQQSPLNSLALIASFYAVMILTTVVILALFAGARSARPRVTRLLVALSAITLSTFGLYQIWKGGVNCIRVFMG
jgi:threonine/homoserine/homoserine lactone efflux protein